MVYGNAVVSGNARVSDNACVFDNASVYDNARVLGDAWVFGDSKCSTSPTNIINLRWNTTITDNNIHIGCKTFELNKALGLVKRWKHTLAEHEEAKTINDEKTLIIEAIKLRLKQLKGEIKHEQI